MREILRLRVWVYYNWMRDGLVLCKDKREWLGKRKGGGWYL